MSTKETIIHLPEGFSGLERICLTANGNLQKILRFFFLLTVAFTYSDTTDATDPICVYTFHSKIIHQNSAWFDGAVTVQIVRNIPTSTDLPNIRGTNRNGTIVRRYDREVNLCCKGKVLCNATSDVVISDNKVVDMIENEGVGIGQLFRYLGKLPTFDLHCVGRTSLTWWRLYTLHITGVDCRIKEVFPNGMFTPGWIDSSDTGLTRADIEAAENETSWSFENF
ncbi:219_t:CDS:2 [Paraglomus occultum]|uniref:219_t:CDS:1 n=1 Tax=Paraglomus occultum TaxID=144539 RepID=A0A9N9FZF3_9GLOM|nr:219_t:CDS:2 [Paraglomus occultum]